MKRFALCCLLFAGCKTSILNPVNTADRDRAYADVEVTRTAVEADRESSIDLPQ